MKNKDFFRTRTDAERSLVKRGFFRGSNGCFHSGKKRAWVTLVRSGTDEIIGDIVVGYQVSMWPIDGMPTEKEIADKKSDPNIWK